ncbi:DUF58 domain-containing protein [Candidatus Laterigemmans baculatus]|uniref:DUF58 domain-containing protein n=1 Tax=Candidatus Laterigemmans baculatus TaxID=2770505 RepID=UPI001F1835EC|nr:DUF58 domain-containing protein [Candidatus Laterigemmans baculatus]
MSVGDPALPAVDASRPSAGRPSEEPFAGAGAGGAGIGVLGWLAAAAALILLGMIAGASLWLYAAYAAVALFVGNRLLARAWSNQAVARRRTGPLEVEVGATVPIEIVVENRGRLPIAWLLVEDLLPRAALLHDPPPLGVEGSRLQLMLLGPGRSRFLGYRLKCNRRGYYQIGPSVLETGDLMGLNRRYRVGAEPQYLLVMPRVIPLAGYDVASRRPIGEIRISDQLMDDPTRLRGIRQWQPGDPLRQVHWAATARTGTLHSKVYEPTTVAGATLVLDLHRDTNPQRHEPVRSELAITLAASLAAALYEMGQPIGLLTNGRDAADRIKTEGWAADFRTRSLARSTLAMRDEDSRLRPVVISADRGPVHQREIQRTLARLELTAALPLGVTLLEAESRLARDTTLIVVLQQAEPSTTAAILGMARRGWSVAIIVNRYDVNDYAKVAGPFIAANIPVMQLVDEQQLPEVCRRVVSR